MGGSFLDLDPKVLGVLGCPFKITQRVAFKTYTPGPRCFLDLTCVFFLGTLIGWF